MPSSANGTLVSQLMHWNGSGWDVYMKSTTSGSGAAQDLSGDLYEAAYEYGTGTWDIEGLDYASFLNPGLEQNKELWCG